MTKETAGDLNNVRIPAQEDRPQLWTHRRANFAVINARSFGDSWFMLMPRLQFPSASRMSLSIPTTRTPLLRTASCFRTNQSRGSGDDDCTRLLTCKR